MSNTRESSAKPKRKRVVINREGVDLADLREIGQNSLAALMGGGSNSKDKDRLQPQRPKVAQALDQTPFSHQAEKGRQFTQNPHTLGPKSKTLGTNYIEQHTMDPEQQERNLNMLNQMNQEQPRPQQPAPAPSTAQTAADGEPAASRGRGRPPAQPQQMAAPAPAKKTTSTTKKDTGKRKKVTQLIGLLRTFRNELSSIAGLPRLVDIPSLDEKKLDEWIEVCNDVLDSSASIIDLAPMAWNGAIEGLNNALVMADVKIRPGGKENKRHLMEHIGAYVPNEAGDRRQMITTCLKRIAIEYLGTQGPFTTLALCTLGGLTQAIEPNGVPERADAMVATPQAIQRAQELLQRTVY